MTADYPVGTEPATPEYVLGTLRRLAYLQMAEGGLISETPLAEFLENYNEWSDPSTRLLADCMNGTFDAKITFLEWSDAFPTVRNRTVGDVCDFLAPRVSRPFIRPWRTVAGECLPAGAFLTVRSLLAAEGVEPDRITPNAMLGPFLRRYRGPFVWKLERMAEGRVPTYLESRPVNTVGLIGFGAALLVYLFAAVSYLCGLHDAEGAAVAAATLTMLPSIAVVYLGAWLPPWRVELEGCVTFRDLAYRLAGQPPRRRIHQSA